MDAAEWDSGAPQGAVARFPTAGSSPGHRASASFSVLEPLRLRHVAGPYEPLPGPRLAVPGKLCRYYNKLIPFRSTIALFHHENRAKNVKKRFLKLLGCYGQMAASVPASQMHGSGELGAPQGHKLPPCQ